MRACRLGLAPRLGLAALVLAALAMGAAGLAIYGLSRTQSLAAEAMAAQRRIEAYGTYSARATEWILQAMTRAPGAGEAGAVTAALDLLDRLVSEDIAAAPDSAEAARRNRQGALTGRLRGQFGELGRALAAAPPGTPAGDAAIAFYAAQVPGLIGQQIAQEVVRRDGALARMERLRHRLHMAAIGLGVAAPLVLAALYLALLRPFFARLASAARAAEGLAMGRHVPGAGGHDELGLLLARLARMAARLDRRRARLAEDAARLEAEVAERTAELSRAHARLEAADSQRRRFFADVGHELRTPLTVILGEAELGAAHPDPDIRRAFATIEARALRLFRRIEDLLRVARSESGRIELDHAPVDLAVAVAAAEADLAPLIQRARLSVMCDVPSMQVTGDADWLRQICGGIIENAVKYAGRGARLAITGRVAPGQGGAPARAVVEFADNGPGLPEAALAGIFDRFARAGAGPGFGVGLALAAWVAEAHGGRLTARRAAEGGLRLRLELPLAGPHGGGVRQDGEETCRAS